MQAIRTQSIRFYGLLLVLMLQSPYLFAQAPLSIPYQAVARNSAGNILPNQAIQMRFTLRNQNSFGPVLFQESQTVNTNALGLLNTQIGSGTVNQGNLSTVNWADGPKFLQVEMDPTLTQAYIHMGTSQLMSVPYALFAAQSGDLPKGTQAHQTMRWNGSAWVADSLLMNTGSRVGIGTASPTAQLHTTDKVRFQGLSGKGSRILTVDSIGNVSARSGDTVYKQTNPYSFSIPDNDCYGLASFNLITQMPMIPLSTISVKLNITHPQVHELYIYLIAPNGNAINLCSGQAGGSNLTETVFGPVGGNWGSGTAPYSGSFIPAGSTTIPCTPFMTGVNLKQYWWELGNGAMIDPNGYWQIRVIDQGFNNLGVLNNWTIQFDMNTSKNNRVPKWYQGELVQSNIYSVESNVGIGTFSPTERLEVNGEMLVNGLHIGRGPGNEFYANTNVRVGNNSFMNNTSGAFNTALGSQTMKDNTSGSANTAIGHRAMEYIGGGFGNTGVGTFALQNAGGGNYNTALGYGAGMQTGNFYNTTAIGNGATIAANNTMVLGGNNGSGAEVNVGIGTNTPNAKLEVNGAIRALGYNTRSGTTFGFGPNLFNYDWTGSFMRAWIDGVWVGNISGTSDRRLKDRIQPQSDNAIDRVRLLKPVRFYYKNVDSIFRANEQEQEGFIADELQEVIPSAVNGKKDAMTENGRIQPQTLNLGPLVSVLTKAIQEQQTLIEELRSRIVALESDRKQMKPVSNSNTSK